MSCFRLNSPCVAWLITSPTTNDTGRRCRASPDLSDSTIPTRRLYDFELEPEVRDWLDSLSDSDFKRVDEVCGMLAGHGTKLGGPWSDHLDGPVWELRDCCQVSEFDLLTFPVVIATGVRTRARCGILHRLIGIGAG